MIGRVLFKARPMLMRLMGFDRAFRGNVSRLKIVVRFFYVTIFLILLLVSFGLLRKYCRCILPFPSMSKQPKLLQSFL